VLDPAAHLGVEAGRREARLALPGRQVQHLVEQPLDLTPALEQSVFHGFPLAGTEKDPVRGQYVPVACRIACSQAREDVMGRRRQIGVLLVLAAGISPAAAATPPTRISYQGVLRNPAGTALAGSFDMTFRLWSASSGGDEIFLDRHLAAPAWRSR
jgi:hypothetical protein